MTKDEAIQIADVIRRVDGGCCACVESACEALTERLKGWTFTRCEDEAHHHCVIVNGEHVND